MILSLHFNLECIVITRTYVIIINIFIFRGKFIETEYYITESAKHLQGIYRDVINRPPNVIHYPGRTEEPRV